EPSRQGESAACISSPQENSERPGIYLARLTQMQRGIACTGHLMNSTPGLRSSLLRLGFAIAALRKGRQTRETPAATRWERREAPISSPQENSERPANAKPGPPGGTPGSTAGGTPAATCQGIRRRLSRLRQGWSSMVKAFCQKINKKGESNMPQS